MVFYIKKLVLILMSFGILFFLGCSQVHLGKSSNGIQVQVELPESSSGRNASGRAASGSLYQVQAKLTAVSAGARSSKVLQSLVTNVAENEGCILSFDSIAVGISAQIHIEVTASDNMSYIGTSDIFTVSEKGTVVEITLSEKTDSASAEGHEWPSQPQDYADIGYIVYRDGTVSSNKIEGKEAIGIVIEIDNSKAYTILALYDAANGDEVTLSETQVALAEEYGSEWSIPSEGKLAHIYQTKKINDALNLVGGESLESGYYWVYSDGVESRFNFSDGTINSSSGSDGSSTARARFVLTWE